MHNVDQLIISNMLYCQNCKDHTKHETRNIGDIEDADICCTVCHSILTTQKV